MSDGWGVDRAARREAGERQHLADLASQTMGIPRRQALRLADRYLGDPHGQASFLVWLTRPAHPGEPLSTPPLTSPCVEP